MERSRRREGWILGESLGGRRQEAGCRMQDKKKKEKERKKTAGLLEIGNYETGDRSNKKEAVGGW